MSQKNQFSPFIDRLIADRYGTAQALADAIGMSLSAFLRGVQHGSLSELNLLRLAEESGEDPLTVLRLAGKPELAAVLERMFPAVAGRRLSALDRNLVELPTGMKRELLRLVRALRNGGDPPKE